MASRPSCFGVHSQLVREQTKTFVLSLGLHAAVLAVLASLAVSGIRAATSEDPIDVEIVFVDDETEAVIEEEPEELEPIPIPTMERPIEVPKKVAVKKVETPEPFQETPLEPGEREAPDDAEAIPTPTAPTMTFSMETSVGGGGADYVSTTVASSGTKIAAPGPAAGAPGAIGNQGAVGVKVAKDWQVTSLPVPINDRDFEPDYPPLAKNEGREARVTVELDIGPSGRVAAARVLSGPRRHGFRKAALSYAKRLRFKAARSGKHEVAARIEWTVYFYARN